MVCIRTASEADIPQILEIEQDAISPPWTHGFLLQAIYQEDSHFVVATACKLQIFDECNDSDTEKGSREKEVIVGFAVLRQVGDDGELMQIAVDKSFRRSGVGDLLIGAILDHAHENSFESVFLEVRKSNTAAVGLYQKHGFTPVRTRKNYYTDPTEDALVMVRQEHAHD